MPLEKKKHFIAAAGLVISNMIQIDFAVCVALKFDRWPCKTIGNCVHAPGSFLWHFIAIHEFKLELSSESTKIEAIFSICRSMWPWISTDDLKKIKRAPLLWNLKMYIISEPYGNLNWRYSPETLNLGQNCVFLRTVWPTNLIYDLEQQWGSSYIPL